MSIIYDALKKSQQQRTTEQKKIFSSTTKQFFPKRKFLVIAISSLVILTTVYYQLHHPTLFKLFHKTPVTAEKKNHEILILNGVFLSNNKKVAMINQQMYALGEDISGMKLEEINEDNIKLRNGKNIETLKILGA